MRKSKIIIGCIISVMTLALTLLIGLPSKVYATETSDYIEDNYSNLVFSNNYFSYTGEQTFSNVGVIASLNNSNLKVDGTNNTTGGFILNTILFNLEIGTYTLTYYGMEYNPGIALIFYDSNNEVIIDAGYTTSSTFYIDRKVSHINFWCSGNGASYDLDVKIMLNKGTSALPYEPYITGSMIYEQAFNKGVEEATNNNGIWKYIRNVYVGTEEDNNYNLSELKSNGFLSGYEMNLYSMSLVANESYSTIYIDFEFTSAPLTELDFFFKGYNSYTMNIYDEDGVAVNIDVSSLTALNYEDILQKNSNFGNYIDTISIVASSPDALNIILNNSSYSEGFQNGYSGGFISGKNEGYSQGFNAGLQDEANNKVHYEDGYEDGSISGYNQGYNEGASSNIEQNAIKTLFNSILSYPVNMISNVFNFDFMGINIASLIMFIVSIGIVVFVVKKFW